MGMKTHHTGSASLWSPVDTDISGLRSPHTGLRWNMCCHCTALQMPDTNHRAADVCTQHGFSQNIAQSIELIQQLHSRIQTSPMWCKMLLLTVQTSHLFTHPSPARAALIDYVKVHAVHLFVRCVVCCPEEEKFCSSHIRRFSGSSFS